MTCTDRSLQSRLQPAAPAVIVPPGTPVPLVFLSLKCAQVLGPVQVTVVETGEVLDLRDDGVAPDTQAGDGIFAATYTPSAVGGYRLNFPGGDTLVVSAEPGYSYQPTTYNYRYITGTSLDLTDDSFATLSLPFAIQFGNAPRSILHVGSNGIVSFREGIAEYQNAPLPAAIDDAIVAPFWDDLYPAPGNVFYEVLGGAPNRELVVEWRDISGYNCDQDVGARFQVVFSEASSHVLFNYADIDFGYGCDDLSAISGGASASVGIQLGPMLGTQYSFNQPSLADGFTLLWTMTGDNPVPVINGTVPANAPASSGDFTLNVDGTGFVYASEILWNGAPRPTTRVNGGRLSTIISNAEIAAPGSAQVAVRNPAPGGGESSVLFQIGPPASLIITAPNGGETWQAGSTQTVAWTYLGDPGPTLSIDLFRREGEKVWTRSITSKVPIGSNGSGSLTFTLPTDLSPGTYRLRAWSEAYPGLGDASDADFIVSPAVTLISPNGGESWAAGSTQTISWTYAGDFASLGCTDMYIQLSGPFEFTIAPFGFKIANVPIDANGSGSYNWSLDDAIPGGSDYRIRITAWPDWGWGDEEDCSSDISDAFTIVGDSNGTKLTVTSPNGGETWLAGSPQTVSWTYNRDPGPDVCIILVKRDPAISFGCYLAPVGSNGSGSYQWNIWGNDMPPGDDYLIVVRSDTNLFVNDASDADFSIHAVPPGQVALAVSRTGSGGGTVTSNPVGIDCGVSCSVSFPGGTVVTLTAVPTSGSVFSGWAGACSGTGPCSLAMDGAKTATATFDLPQGFGFGSPPAPRTVTAGQPAQFTVQVLGQTGFAGVVSFACTAGVPQGAVCSFNPPSVSLGNGTATTTLTVTTTARTVGMSTSTSVAVFACWLLPLGLLMAPPAKRSRQRSWLAFFVVLILLAGSLVACGGGSAPPSRPTAQPNPLGTPAGTYAITVTATSGGVSQAQTVTLVVN